MKVLIDEISKFINEGWPGNDWYMDDCSGPGFGHLTDDGEAPQVPGTLVELDDFDCAVLWQGKGEDPSHRAGYSFITLFCKWRKAQAVATLSVEAPKGKLEAVRAAIKAAGGKVLNA